MSNHNDIKQQAHIIIRKLMAQHHDITRDQLYQQTCQQLVVLFQLSDAAAADYAIQALAEQESEGINGFMDVSASSTYCLYVVVDGVKRAITLKQITEYIEGMAA